MRLRQTALNAPLPAARGLRPLLRCFVLAFSLATPLAVHSQAEPTYSDVAAIFGERCVICHSGPTPPAGLRLDSLDAVLTGSARGPVVKAGSPGESELVRRIKGISQPRMPITGPPFLSASEIATIERWIAGGLMPGEPTADAPPPIAAPRRPRPGERVTWRHVAPILATRCAKCHTDNGLMGPAPEGLRLTSYQATLASFERARVIPGNPAGSELLRRVRGQARPRMPFDGPPYLDPEEIRLIEDWIAQGARDSNGTPSAVPAGADVRLHGTLERGGRLDDLDLILTPRTRIDKSPRPGDYVQVRGRVDRDGSIVVERLRPR